MASVEDQHYEAAVAANNRALRIAELEAALNEVHGAHHECVDKLGMANNRIAELEARNKTLAEALRSAADNIAWKWPADAKRMRELADSN